MRDPLDLPLAVWPDWDGRDYDSVASYANPAELEDAAIAPWVRFNNLDEDDPLEQLADVFKYVQSLRIRYGLEPWISGQGQRIRWPALIRRDCGTCLDLAVLFASVLLRCQFRPLLVFAESTMRTENHVVVLVDLRGPIQDLMLRPDSSELPLLREKERGRHTYSFHEGRVPEGFAIFDATSATVSEERWTFEEAEETALVLLEDEVHYPNKVVLDVASAIRTNAGGPYPIPNESTGASAVWTRLPPRYTPPPLPDSDELVESLRAAEGRIALVGESGTGKSTIAYRTAAGWDNGYGWFLNAADRSTLQSELAQVELLHRSRSLAVSQVHDDQVALSRAALRRLAQSRMPWVMVVDNADNEPGSIADLLPDPRWSGQIVIVTSTHTGWASWADTSMKFGGISPASSRIAETETAASFGRAIEVDIRVRLLKRGIEVTADDLSSLVELCKNHLSFPAQQLAITIAWAPATQLEAPPLVRTASRGALRSRLVELERLGLVGTTQSRGWTVAMHRAIAADVRKWDPNTPQAGARRLERLMANEYVVEVLAERAEESVLMRLIRLAERSAKTRRIVGSIFTLSGVLEGRGMSTEAAAVANLCLDHDKGDLSPSRVALAKLRVVRHTKNHAKDIASLERALSLVTEIVEGLPKSSDREGNLFYYQCVATEGLVRRQLAKRALQGEYLTNELEAARALIVKAASRRAEIIGPDDWRASVEREMAFFGIAAVSLDLGKCTFSDPERAALLLGDSLQMYTAVRDAINEFHGYAVIHPRGAAAEYGRALCYYYSALLGVPPRLRSNTQIFGIPSEYEAHGRIEEPPLEQSEKADEELLLSAAHDALQESLRGRVGLQVGNQGSVDVVKCLRLGIEISAARIVWAHGSRSELSVRQMSTRMVEDLLVETEQNFRNDWQHFGGVSTGEYGTYCDPDGRTAGYRRRWSPSKE